MVPASPAFFLFHRGKHLAVRAARLCVLARQRRLAGPPGGSLATRTNPSTWKAKTRD